MNGIEIQYLLGLFFLVNSLSWTEGRISADAVRLIAGVVLIVMSILSFSLIK